MIVKVDSGRRTRVECCRSMALDPSEVVRGHSSH